MAYTDIDDPSLYFRIKTYTGNGTNDTAITWDETHANMQPDWLWFKNRSAAQSHAVFDSVRGATLRIIPNENGAEGTENTNLDSFDSNGFTVDNEAIVNGNGNNMIAWGWKAGGSASSNSNGSISSSVSVNTTAGFSIVSFTTPSSGTFTVGHGLSSVPKLWLHKRRDGSDHWQFYHESVGNTKKLLLSATNAEGTSAIWQDTTPTSSIMYLGAAGTHLNASATYIAYCFAEKQGYSSFGSYTGNGNADGPFVYTGFKPAWVIIKRTDSTADWHIQDNKRNTFNPVDTSLFANTNDADTQSSSYDTDFLSNGFKLRGTTTARNGSGNTYIYWAFAESPFTNSSGVPNNAR